MQSSRRSLERGQGLVEYALALVLVAVVVIVVLALTGVSLRKVFCGIVYQVRGTSTPGIASCPEPYVTVLGVDGSRNPRIEAIIQDDKGGTDSTNMDLWFTLIGPTPLARRQELNFRYCLDGGGGSGAACGPVTLSAGSYKLLIEAVDMDGNTSVTSVSFVAN